MSEVLWFIVQKMACILQLSAACHQCRRKSRICKACWEIAYRGEQEKMKSYVDGFCSTFGCWEVVEHAGQWYCGKCNLRGGTAWSARRDPRESQDWYGRDRDWGSGQGLTQVRALSRSREPRRSTAFSRSLSATTPELFTSSLRSACREMSGAQLREAICLASKELEVRASQ